jgi:cellobiose phosphorylase
MYQAAIQALLGLRRHGSTMSVNPCIPTVWPEFSMSWTFGGTSYRITVVNPEHQGCGPRTAELDGVMVDPDAIPLRDDGAAHDIRIVLRVPSLVDAQLHASTAAGPDRRDAAS